MGPTLVIRALCVCAISAIRAISADNKETPSAWEGVFTTEEITLVARAAAKTNDGDLARITNRRVGRVLGRMRTADSSAALTVSATSL